MTTALTTKPADPVNYHTHPLRHSIGRKLDAFEDAPIVVVRTTELATLRRFFARELNVTEPFDEFITDVPIVFVLIYNGEEYVVNTEGYTYSRYVFKVGGTH